MSYSIEHDDESLRLETQSNLPTYDLTKHLKDIEIKKGFKVLDAGCGSGLLSRNLDSKWGNQIQIDACDFSDLRLSQARSFCNTKSTINFFNSNLEKIDSPDSSYDLIICRYVWEHLECISKVASEFHRILKPGGKAHIIDGDGVLFNLYSTNIKLNQYLETIKNNLQFDFYVGRKIPSYLTSANFKDISWQVNAISFQGENLKSEHEQYKLRLNFARPTLDKILGNDADEFIKLYLKEMLIPGNTIFLNEFIVSATK